jgi:hypothetical protein
VVPRRLERLFVVQKFGGENGGGRVVLELTDPVLQFREQFIVGQFILRHWQGLQLGFREQGALGFGEGEGRVKDGLNLCCHQCVSGVVGSFHRVPAS